jgi:hypothetical protein
MLWCVVTHGLYQVTCAIQAMQAETWSFGCTTNVHTLYIAISKCENGTLYLKTEAVCEVTVVVFCDTSSVCLYTCGR